MSSLRERFNKTLDVFSGYSSRTLEDSQFVVFGVPLDETCTWMKGARHGPDVVRYTSKNIESFSLTTKTDVEDARICDLGDLKISSNLEETIQSIRATTSQIRSLVKIPIMLGGEHTITLGAIPEKKDDLTILQFDAHMDLRDTYEGRSISHTTFMRRVAERTDPHNIIQVGVRAISKEEHQFAQKSGIFCVSASELSTKNIESIANRIKERMNHCKSIYLTIDIDVVDPAFAPAVGNPEAIGVAPLQLIDLIRKLVDKRLVGVDLVEVAPRETLKEEPYFDTDAIITGALASRILFETILAVG